MRGAAYRVWHYARGMIVTAHAETQMQEPRAESAGLMQSPLRHLDPASVSAAAKVESRNREVHLPPVSTYRWWARRTAAVNGAIIDAVAQDMPGSLLIADIFAGGGVIPLAAVIRGHKVYAQDLNPWAVFGLSAMLGLPDPDALREATASLEQWIRTRVQYAYGTTMSDGEPGLVSHTFRVATAECTFCGHRARLYPHALVSLTARRERKLSEAFLACPAGHLFLGDIRCIQSCPHCSAVTDPDAVYTRGRSITCSSCGHAERLHTRAGTWEWEAVLVERSRRGRRELAQPKAAETEVASDESWKPTRDLGDIPPGQETRVLIRHGFTRWDQIYPARQRKLLELLLDKAAHCSSDPAVTHAVTAAVIGSAEMAGHLSRWDRFYLKSYESMAGHRFNLTTFAAEPNVWGTPTSGRGTVLRRLNQLVKAATWLHARTGKTLVIDKPHKPQDQAAGTKPLDEDVRVVEGSSEKLLLPPGAVSLVLTDPPYHDDVQYGELSLPFRAWARLADHDLTGDAVVNAATGQLVDDGAYEQLLTRIFAEVRRTLRPDGHLIFSYANRTPSAWVALFAALQQAGLRACGCEIVHSENETDHAKRGVRACTLDLILDLTPAAPSRAHVPTAHVRGEEADFLRTVAATFLRVGQLDGNWRMTFLTELRNSAFLMTPGADSEPGD
jgi:putative DNA methylase